MLNLWTTKIRTVLAEAIGSLEAIVKEITLLLQSNLAMPTAFIERLTFWARDTLAKLQFFGCKEEKQSVSSLVVVYRNDFFVLFVYFSSGLM